MKVERIKKLEDYIVENGTASLDTLCKVFDVSKNTIRRDVSELESKGIIKKVYGGVTSLLEETTVPFTQREVQYISEKHHIGMLASQLVNDGDIIFIDSGSTTIHLIPHIKHKQNITVITNSLNVIVEATHFNNLNILSTGGLLQRQTNSFTGSDSRNFLENFNINKAFMATTGISIEKGVTNSSFSETKVKKTVVDISQDIIILADHSKLDSAALMTYCPLSRIDCLVTDHQPPKRYVNFFNEHNIKFMYKE